MPACIRKVRVKPLKCIEHQKIDEAQLLDLSIPLNSSALTSHSKKLEACAFSFHVPMTLADICNFYEEEMERSGWRKLACTETLWNLLDEDYSLLLFEKPQRTCSITVVRKNNVQKPQSEVTIIVSEKIKSPEYYDD